MKTNGIVNVDKIYIFHFLEFFLNNSKIQKKQDKRSYVVQIFKTLTSIVLIFCFALICMKTCDSPSSKNYLPTTTFQKFIHVTKETFRMVKDQMLSIYTNACIL